MQNKSRAYNIYGAVPLLFQSWVWFLVEALVALGVLLFLDKAFFLHTISPLIYVGILLIVLVIGEASRRSFLISKIFFISVLRLWGWISSTIKRLSRASSFISLIFLLVTLIFVIVVGRFIFVGSQHPLTNKPESAGELFVSVLTVVTAVIAIFFAGAALVVEIILGVYTSQFVRAFVRHWIFLTSLVLMIFIAIGNLLPLRLGWNESFASASLASAIYVIICLGILVGLLTRFLQVPLIVREVSSQILLYIRSSLPRPRAPLTQYRKTPRHLFLEKLRYAFEIHILGRYPRTTLPTSVPTGFSKDLQERTRPIFSACLRAVTEDKRDIVLACLDSIVAISISYLKARRNYSFPDDTFMIFLASQFEILFNAALKEANEQFTADIIEAASEIGKASLLLTETQLQPDENSIAGMWSDFLAKSCLKSLPLQHTSAPIAACEGITQIGRRLLAQGAYTTALFGVANNLQQIGNRTASIRGLWPSNIAKSAVWGLVLMLNDTFIVALEKGYYHQFACKTICDALDSITQAAFGQDRSFDTYMTISAPLVGSLWMSGNIIDVLYQVLQAASEKTEPRRYRIIADTISIIDLVHQTGLRVIRHRGPFADYSSALSHMTWCTILFLKDQEDPQLIELGKKILHRILITAHIYSRNVMRENSDIMSDHLSHISPIYAFLTYFAQHYSNQVLVDELFDTIAEFPNLLSEFAEVDRDCPGYRQLYRYVKMYAAWIHKYFPENPVASKLLHSLAENAAPKVISRPFFSSRIEKLDYPSSLGAEKWYIFPSRYWGPDAQWTITDELNDMDNYITFDTVLKNLVVN